ncbi:MAG: DNA methyltransferase [Candidatus Odinarchaeota archaeon]
MRSSQSNSGRVTSGSTGDAMIDSDLPFFDLIVDRSALNGFHSLVHGDVLSTVSILPDILQNRRFKLLYIDLPVYDPQGTITSSRDNDGGILTNFSAFERQIHDFLTSAPLNNYIRYLSRILVVCRELLRPDGFLCVKSQGPVRYHLKVLLDAVFGYGFCVNEIIIDSPSSFHYSYHLPLKETTGSLFLYSKEKGTCINPVLNQRTSGGYWHTFISKRQGPPRVFAINGIKRTIAPPPGTHWKLSQKKIDKKCTKGEIRLNSKGMPEYWVPLKKGQIIDNNWLDINSHARSCWNGTLTSRKLFERILLSFTDEGDLAGVIFSGLGEFSEVCTEKKRRWVAITPFWQLATTANFRLSWIKASYRFLATNGETSSKITSDLPLMKFSVKNVNPERKHGSKQLQPLESFDQANSQSNIANSSKNSSWPLQTSDSSAVNSSGEKRDWKNILIHGDNLQALELLVKDFSRKIKLIYIDPPHFTGLDQKIDLPTPFSNTEEVAYGNILSTVGSLQTFQSWLFSRVSLMKQLLRQDGFIFVRFSYHLSHYAKLVLDSVFGEENFLGEILVRRMKKNLANKQKGNQTHLIINSDSLFLYQVSNESQFNKPVKKKRRKNGLEKEYGDPWDNIWLDIPGYQKTKRTLYPTENSEVLLSRIIELCSEEGDLVADFFAGSATTLAVAEVLGRYWIGVDVGHFAIHESRKRILRIPRHRSFILFKVADRDEQLVEKGSRDRVKSSSVCLLESGVTDAVLSETPLLKMRCQVSGRDLQLELVDYQFLGGGQPLEQEQGSFIDLIDYWAVDWNYSGRIFQSRWFSSREFIRRQVKNKINPVAEYCYSSAGKRDIAVKLVDIEGNEVTGYLGIKVE